MRASDADRDKVAQRLGAAMAEGRLDLTEYDRRLEQVMRAKTFGELEVAVRDLPISAEEREKAEKERKQKAATEAKKEWYDGLRSWLATAVVLNAIYLFTNFGDKDWGFYWPMIPLGIWAVFMIVHVISPDNKHGSRDRHERRRDGRHGPHGPHGHHGSGRDE